MRSAMMLLLAVLVLAFACGGGEIISLDDAVGDGGPVAEVTADVPADLPRRSEEVVEPDLVFDMAEGTEVQSDTTWEPGPGDPGYPCTKDSDCLSGFCIETPDGKLCTVECQEECPFGWECALHKASLPDEVHICAPTHMNLCRPCQANSDCETNGVDLGDWCVPAGAAGSFCGAACNEEAPCPAGYECVEATSVTGETGMQCRLVEGECACTKWFADQGATTECRVENEFGECAGMRGCTADGLTPCDAPVPEAESCDGDDNDCDGDVDEGTGGDACSLTNEFGECAGTEKCDDGELVCVGTEAKPEACDGVDNDCDGETDEGFPDTDEDGVADCMENDKDGDGVVDGKDNCPFDGNPGQEDFDLDGDGDACDLDDDNDMVADTADCAPMDKNVHPGAMELCNGVDDDCDDEVDEGHPDTDLDGTMDCLDEDDDGDGDPDLTDCAPLNPAVFSGAEEACDGKDNDCDAQVDEGYADTDLDGSKDCVDPDDDNDLDPDQTDCAPVNPAIHNGAKETCDGVDNDCVGGVDDGLGETTCGKGECQHTVENCVAGELQPCDPLAGAADEACDGKDNDCDGLTDEGLGTTTCGKGECQHTVQNCVGGVAQLCDPMAGTEVESCDGLDNDCDGLTDEGLGTTTCGLGACQHKVANCQEGQEQQCDPLEGASDEVCDGKDNDCDGETDEELGETWCGAGECHHAVPYCVGGKVSVCDPFEGASDEICDGKDNDCDSQVDDGLGQLSCGMGECAHSVPACIGGEAQVCDPMAGTEVEVCDGLDNDCDGDTDEELGQLACGLGECFHVVDACIGGEAQVCDPMAGTEVEICDGLDNDCDGDTDEELGQLACGLGECFHVIDACIGGEAQVCDPMAGTEVEICDGLDNDCDGDTDEELGQLACGLGECFHVIDACIGGEAQVCDPMAGTEVEICDGLDNDCDGIEDNEGLVCGGCLNRVCPVSEVMDGSVEPGTDLAFQYAPTAAGEGFIRANWTAAEGAVGYRVRIGTEPYGEDVLPATEIGEATAWEATGLSLEGAWTEVVYYVTVAPLNSDGEAGTEAVSNGVRIAEAASWDGSTVEGLNGGYTLDWPEAGVTAFFGRHYFETVTIPAEAVVRVQGWGREDGVTESIAPDHAAVLLPSDGWLELYGNTIEVSGIITASGRGYGGGGGGGGGSGSVANRGRGGGGGLGGNGADGEGGSTGGGGGGSPGGKGGWGGQGNGGNGNLFGGGSGSTACTGNPGRNGGDGPAGEVGGTGGTASSGNPGQGGTGEFAKGGANGVYGCDNWTGGGGGGYGGGGSGGTQWNSGGTDSGGGGGGGSGGVGGGHTANGGKGAGPFGGAGGAANASAGGHGGYLAAGGNGDDSTDRSLHLGSGGGGGGTGYQETGGGGGGAGGGWLVLYASETLTVTESGRILANGAGAGGGGRDDGGASTSHPGGAGAGGGILLEAETLHIANADTGHLSARGGNGSTAIGGTIKLFYNESTGQLPGVANAGRVYASVP